VRVGFPRNLVASSCLQLKYEIDDKTMDREIKFRIWDKDAKTMEQVLLPDCSTYQVMPAKQEGKEFKRRDNTVLMQYTGLTDRNGKEIYEGDVIEWNRQKYEIKWLDEWAALAAENERENQVVPKIATTSEVIGNVYKNPELIQ
jgi:hypothetical protein